MIRDPRRFGDELRSYAIFNIPIALLAIVVAWWAGRWISSRAVHPLTAVTGALNALADGDFSAKAIKGLDQSEVGVLVDAFNRATASVAKAMRERDLAQLELRRFVADAGHELRTPLTIVIGYIDALRLGVVSNPSGMSEIVDAVGEEGQRMRHIVEDLITLARLDHPEAHRREVVALRDVVSDVLDALPSREKQRVHDAGGDAVVHVDHFAIHRAVRNVIDNALRYTQETVDVRVERDGTFALVTVEDRGPGMSEHEAQLAFERFRRGQREDGIEGTGLGLAIVKSAVEASGGTVTLRSSPERGTKIALRMPLAAVAQLSTAAV